MSTEHQQYSPRNQADAIEEYAVLHQISSNNFPLPFIKAILSMTKPDMLACTGSRRGSEGVSHSLLEKEHEGLVRDIKAVERSFGVDMLTLAVALRYLERLLKNAKVKRYLEGTCPELFVLMVGLLQETRTIEPSAA